MENARAGLREEAQKWAGLKVDPHAELFVFVGRWSMQKGIDLIADIFPQILEQHPRTQLICVGPVIDLYGKFAAIKLERLMKIFPGRVYSKPEFTALPPYIFSGAEFALIPSRDEPFGLVAVEFGRKGALGVGARVGGLGQVRFGVLSFEYQAPFSCRFATSSTILSPGSALSCYVYFMSPSASTLPTIQFLVTIGSLSFRVYFMSVFASALSAIQFLVTLTLSSFCVYLLSLLVSALSTV